ncbi:GGDEF domain-containing response regulator [Methylophaga sulfidovorans]|uniref:diguanylate cyclase n=1 Tax=Methylophaga sulfidovorans TaxID=45496 RepID=A0A1I4AYU3_9GAMM|nr:diguanylate cyclase [Methylophaga sulfidovorans]SFK61685.1 two-component system, cell cycle response regulator [Methylophaga sulfidovorans]
MLNALVIDSSPLFCEHMIDLLESAGFNVETAMNGADGLGKAATARYRLVCCSDNLPDYASSEFCSQLRALNGYDFATLLVLTEHDNSKILKQALLAGATDIFSKNDMAEMDTYLSRLSQRESRQLSGRVLFIEDSRVLQTIIIDLLTDMGLDVDAYNYAESAWEAFKGGDYDLVITDIMLEGSMSGITLVRKIRRMQSEYSNVPIIATSGFDNMSRKIELFHLGVNDYVSKPIVREELRQRVFNHVTSYQTTQELRTQQKSLHSLAMLDETTGLFNRHALREFASKYFSEAYRFNRCLSLAVIDIDHLKDINERYGFEHGDQMLSELGSWMKRHVRDVDLVARWAGDELVLLLPECDLASANNMMERMVQRLSKLKPANLEVTVSIGIAQLRQEDNDNLNSLFELADKAMYQAKMAGRNCVRLYIEPEAVPEFSNND